MPVSSAGVELCVMGLVVEGATGGDSQRSFEIRVCSFSDFRSHPRWYYAYDELARQYFSFDGRSIVESHATHVIMALQNDAEEYLGSLFLSACGKVWIVQNVLVRLEKRRQGVASALLNASLEYAQSISAARPHALMLYCKPELQRFYAGRGYSRWC